VFLNIIDTRIGNKCEIYLDETLFGFRNAHGTREAMSEYSPKMSGPT